MKRGVSVVSFVVVLCMVLMTARQAQAAINCGQVTGALAPCLSYLIGSGGTPTAGCCAGVRRLQSLAATQADRRTACNCVKSAASGYSNLRPDRASGLPGKCGVKFNFNISPSTNCNSIP
ncbi:OLC1v1009548C1 [Oldenlandia corymbosa var. corymbosa]|uniref:Non-specific lipid-transfer protein n=1 Tax=Oldenlandia corymbosa var. corymbosa TaxID=529605 RepID=A0AAV1DSF5_OLDCO|nr:OLC1v1009548C1 [Oldenlandia corymbosa var. corymbosa]